MASMFELDRSTSDLLTAPHEAGRDVSAADRARRAFDPLRPEAVGDLTDRPRRGVGREAAAPRSATTPLRPRVGQLSGWRLQAAAP